MRKNLLTRSVAVLSGVAMLTALAACGLGPGEYGFYAVTGSGPGLRAERLE